jgi:transposase-like protein
MMKRVNKYYRSAKISEAKFRQILRCFDEDLTASSTARLTGVSVRSVNSIFLKLRRRMAELCDAEPLLNGTVEVDESYFGPHRIKGKRGRGAGGKTIVFGILKRGDRVWTQIVPDAKKRTLQRVIRGKVSLDSIIHTDGWIGYDGLVDVGYAKHLRVRHGENEFANRSNHINGIESFWSFAKHRLAQFKGVPRHTFYVHLKESEFRFNHRNQNLYKLLLRILREDPL